MGEGDAKPTEYAIAVVRAAKDAGFTDDESQLQFIHKGLTAQLSVIINPPSPRVLVDQYLQTLELRKREWFTIASEYRTSSYTQDHVHVAVEEYTLTLFPIICSVTRLLDFVSAVVCLVITVISRRVYRDPTALLSCAVY